MNASLKRLDAGLKTRLILLALVLLLLVAEVVWWARYLWSVAFSTRRAWKLALSKDQNANAAFNGSEDETISSRAARARDSNRRWGCILCRLLDAIDHNHCNRSKGV
ncbi:MULTISPECIES: hypothetical protein [Giesbergeria]|uniref:ATP synthase F0 subunit 8 n=1 Tax=Giesbergeria sinuosa TaxID=80883 RepID=A0ABV9QCF3_9BURK